MRVNHAFMLPAVLGLAVAGPAAAGVLYQDDFEDGIVDPIFVAVGNAQITESGGKLRIQTFGVGDGVEIQVPSHARCVRLSAEIPEEEFDRFEAYGVAAMFRDDDGSEVVGIGAEFLRPFWNRCQVTFKVDKDKQTEGFWG